MTLPTPGVTPANWGAQLNAHIDAVANAPRSVLPKPSGYYFTPFPYTGSGDGSAGARTASEIEFSPLLLSSAVTVSAVYIKVSVGAAGSTHRIGIYADSNGLPGTLVADFGSLATGSAAYFGITGLSQSLDAGYYWMAIIQQGTATSTVWSGGNGAGLVADSRSNGQFLIENGGAGPIAYRSSAATFTGALPTPAPALSTASATYATRFALLAA